MNSLPSGWTIKPLGDIATLQRGFDLPIQQRTPGDVPVFAANGIVGNHNEAKVRGPGVVTGRSGTLGEVHFVESDYWPLNTSLWVKDFHGNDPKWVARLLKWMRLDTHTRGTGVPTLNRNLVHAVSVAVPPLEEQRRIAAILDKADAVCRKRQEAIALTEELLRAAFLEMFGDPGQNPHQWTTGCIGDIAEIVTDGTHQTPTRSESGVMLLSARNIKNGYIDISEDVDFVPPNEYYRLRKSYDPKRQDVLISCSGSVGRVTVVRDFGSFSMVRSVAVVRPKLKLINSEFLESLLHSAYLRSSMVKSAKQSSQANLFQGAIKDLPVILPPLPLQEQWQTFKLRVRETAKRYSQMQDSQTELFNSLLQRAFRGEL